MDLLSTQNWREWDDRLRHPDLGIGGGQEA
jgi:hypothetical protein